MKKISIILIYLFISFGLINIYSCVKLHNNNPDDSTKVYFDFATIGDHDFTLDYKLTFNSPIVFYVYDEYPFIPFPGDSQREVFKEGLNPILKGITENFGKYSGIVNVKKTVKQLYIYSTTIGVSQLLKTVYSNGKFTVDASNSASYITSAAAIMNTGINEPLTLEAFIPGFTTLGTWNTIGVPDYLLSPSISLSAALINDINISLPETKKVPILNPQFIANGVMAALHIIENAKIELVFIHEGASYKNVLGYFHYPTSNPPTSVGDINKIIAFPNVSYSSSGGGLSSGNRVKLMYWTGTTLTETFPAGTSIGWFIEAYGYNNDGSISQTRPFYYSFEQFNPETDPLLKPHNVLLFDPERNIVLIGFEDVNRSSGSDNDFNDAMFYAAATPETAIQYTDLPLLIKSNDKDSDGIPDDRDEFPTDPLLCYTTDYPSLGTYHSLAFEDLWPSRGDYDMNDVVLSYNSTHYLNARNLIVKTIDRIKPLWSGGILDVGFGYQMGVSPSVVTSVTKTSAFVDGNFRYNLSSNGTENGQSKATMMVFDNVLDLNLTSGAEKPVFSIQTLFTTPQTLAQVTTPPYNPFIVVNINSSRGREVHMPNYKPTDLADLSQLGTINDKSAPLLNRYYISDDEMPFGILIPANFDFPDESVSITVYYPKFLSWAKSLGVDYPDWYLYKR